MTTTDMTTTEAQRIIDECTNAATWRPPSEVEEALTTLVWGDAPPWEARTLADTGIPPARLRALYWHVGCPRFRREIVDVLSASSQKAVEAC